MGQKANPHGLRLGINKGWESIWYAEKDFAKYLMEDHQIRKYIKKKLYASGISHITIQRTTDRIKITIFTSKPGIIIGRNGQAIQELTGEIQKFTSQKADVGIQEPRDIPPRDETGYDAYH